MRRSSSCESYDSEDESVKEEIEREKRKNLDDDNMSVTHVFFSFSLQPTTDASLLASTASSTRTASSWSKPEKPEGDRKKR